MSAKMKANFINSVASGQKIPCPFCSTLNDSDALFCYSCGKTLNKPAEQTVQDSDDIICPVCQTANNSDSRFCISCGAKLVKVQDKEETTIIPETKENPAFEPAAEPVKEEKPAFGPASEPVKEEKPAFEPAAEPVKEENPAFEPAKKVNSAPIFNTIIEQVEEEEEEVSVFAQGLPDWDIVPPHAPVRRKHKK